MSSPECKAPRAAVKRSAATTGPSGSRPWRRRFVILHAAAYLATAGVAAAELMVMPVGPRFFVSAALLAAFTGLLVAVFTAEHSLSTPWFLATSIAASVVVVAIMAVGPGPLFGAILFFVVCTIVGMRMNTVVAVAWVVAATGSLMVCLIASGDRNWVSTMISFGVGFFAFIAFSMAYRRSQQAHAESEQLLAELTSAQGRLRDLAVVDERQRIAREMHDAVGHRLTAAAVLLEGAARLIPTEPVRAATMVETSRAQVRAGLDELRAAVGALNAVPGGDQPLAQVLGALADIASQGTGLRVTLTIAPGLPEPDQQRRVVIVRTVQEALTNVQKHAAASRADLALDLEGRWWTLTCADDGRGPTPGTVDAAHGFGLRNLAARAAALGGTVELLREEPGTTLLRLRVPDAGEPDGKGPS